MLLDLWSENAAAWADAISQARIASRVLATDAAVVDAVVAASPRAVLDVGCGEGWLVRRLAGLGVPAAGVDAQASLIERARAHGPGDYRRAAYGDLHELPGLDRFDVWVCNFALFDEADAPTVVSCARRRLPVGGRLIVQTVHAAATRDGPASVDGWQPGGWGGCGPGFGRAIPWYFRSEATWRALIADHGFAAVTIESPLNPHTGAPLSMLVRASRPG